MTEIVLRQVQCLYQCRD